MSTFELALSHLAIAFAAGLAGIGVSLLLFARDKRVVTLKPGEVVVDQAALEALKERIEKVEKNPLKHSPRAKVRPPPEEDFGDGEDDEIVEMGPRP